MKILPNKVLEQTIKCPICKEKMTIEGGSLLCRGIKRHCYDISSSGYLNLMTAGHTDSGDSKAAVNARRFFLGLDYYRPVADALSDTLKRYIPVGKEKIIIDAGCGEGYYTSKLAECGYSVAGIDLSKFAVDAAAKQASACNIKNGLFCVGSVFDLPFFDNMADGIVNIFTPCAEEEFIRVIKKGGYLTVVYAGKEHLMGLKQAIYENVRENDERRDLPKKLKLIESKNIRFDITVEGTNALLALFAMTPYYWKTSQSDGEKLKKLDKLTTAVDMVIAVYQKI